MIASPSGLQVDIDLCELQLDVIDVVEKQHQDPYVVVSDGRQRMCIVQLIFNINKIKIIPVGFLKIYLILITQVQQSFFYW